MEYGASIWDPHKSGVKHQLNKLQRSAARFVRNDYQQMSSVTQMLKELGWPDLADRRRDQRLTLLYKVINGYAEVPTEDILSVTDNRTRSKHKF